MTQTPAEILTRILEAYDHHDLDTLESLVADNIVDHYLPFGKYEGKDESMRMAREIFAAFPDFRLRILNIVGDDIRASAMWKASGTFTGEPFMGIRATGRKVELQGCDFMEMANGKAVRATMHFDGADFARQVGMLPGAGSIAERLIAESFNMTTVIRKGASELAGLVGR